MNKAGWPTDASVSSAGGSARIFGACSSMRPTPTSRGHI